MNRTILLTILCSVAASIGWAQDTEQFFENGGQFKKNSSKTANPYFPPEKKTTSNATEESPDTLPIGLRQLQAELRNAELKLAKQRESFGNQHPSVIEQERLIKSLETMIRDQQATIKPGLPENQATSTKPKKEANVPTHIKVFALRYCEAKTAVEVLRQLITTPSVRIVADERTNSVIVNAPVEQFELQTIEALLLRLDVATQAQGAKIRPVENETNPKAAAGSVILPSQPTVDIKEQRDQITQLRKDYESFESQASRLAEALRQSPNDAKRTELRKIVQTSFMLRQRLLRAELLEMQTRLIQTQRSIDMRERITDQIVDRRVEELLNPHLTWDAMPASGSKGPQTSTVRPDHSRPPAPISLGLSAEISDKAWGEPQNGLRLAIVVQAENAPWNQSQEVQYVVENVSSNSIHIKEQRNDQLASLMDVRLTSQAQVQTSPRVNSGYMEAGNTVELLPGQQAVVARVWIGVVDKETDATPQGNPQLLVIDPDAWKFINKIYLLRGALQPDPENPHVSIRSGQVGIAFHKSATASSSSDSTSPPEKHSTSKASADLTSLWLAKLEGYWDFEELSIENPESIELPGDVKMVYRIHGNLLESPPGESSLTTWYLRFGPPSTPQSVDLCMDPEGKNFMPGIIEFSDDLVRICHANTFDSHAKRPEVFAVEKDTDIFVLRRRPAPISELEGDWHRVASRDEKGHSKDVTPCNTTFRGDRYTATFPGGTFACRIQINSEPKTIWYFSKEEDGTFMMDHFELKGDQLILRDSMNREEVFERDHIRIPSVVPSATDSQESRWRSAVVEIMVSGKPDISDNSPRKIGFGIIMATDGTMISHMSGGWATAIKNWPNIDARFDDGSVVPLQVIEEGGSGFLVLRPKESINVNHHFQLSNRPTEIGDQVYVGQMVVTSIESGLYSLAATIVKLGQTDRLVAMLSVPVWQLTPAIRIPNSFCFPVLSEDGKLLAITLADTGGLLLAVPVERLKEMFPKSLNPPSSTDETDPFGQSQTSDEFGPFSPPTSSDND